MLQLIHYRMLFATMSNKPKKGKIMNLLAGKFVILTEKIKKYIWEICHTGGKFCKTGGKFLLACREINIFSGPDCWRLFNEIK